MVADRYAVLCFTYRGLISFKLPLRYLALRHDVPDYANPPRNGRHAAHFFLSRNDEHPAFRSPGILCAYQVVPACCKFVFHPSLFLGTDQSYPRERFCTANVPQLSRPDTITVEFCSSDGALPNSFS